IHIGRGRAIAVGAAGAEPVGEGAPLLAVPLGQGGRHQDEQQQRDERQPHARESSMNLGRGIKDLHAIDSLLTGIWSQGEWERHAPGTEGSQLWKLSCRFSYNSSVAA